MEKYEANAQLTGISLSYTNKKRFIADKIFNRVSVTTKNFQYYMYDKTSNLQLPDTTIGSTGMPNTADFDGNKITASVKDEALTTYIPKDDIDEAKADGENLFNKRTEKLTETFNACREKKIADLLQDEKNYGSNVKKLGNNEKFTLDNVDAFKIINEAASEVWIKPNVMIGSRKAIDALRENPFVVKAVNRNNGGVGKVTLQELKEKFELDEVLVGESVVNTAKKGQIPNYVGAWGNAIILAYIDPTADTDGGITFGFTAQKGQREVYKNFDEFRGVKGVHGIKIAEQRTDLIVAPDCGYLITNIY